MAQLLIALVLSSAVLAPGQASSTGRIAAPSEKPPAGETQKPAAPALTCRLLTEEGPRGGRLEVEGENFGKAPLVRIAGRVTRMIERTETKIAVQIPRDSNGGLVSVKSGKLEAECGTLTIIGKD